MPDLLRHRAVAVWALLVAATLLSCWLAADHGVGDERHRSGVLVLGIACLKIRLVGLHFMELRTAPRALRGAFEAYVMVLFVLLSGMSALA
jgi:heme/copper-type cytochrome/quinol oxidase subunit 4